MKRVAVVGCPCSGKSYLARQIAAITELPLVHLDRAYYTLNLPKDDEERRRVWRTELQKIISQPRWITDGNYKSTFDMRFSAADTIILLDYPMWLVVWRLFMRRLKHRNKPRTDMPDGWKERLSWSFYKRHVYKFKKRYYPTMYKVFEALDPEVKIIILKSPRETNKFLKELKSDKT